MPLFDVQLRFQTVKDLAIGLLDGLLNPTYVFKQARKEETVTSE